MGRAFIQNVTMCQEAVFCGVNRRIISVNAFTIPSFQALAVDNKGQGYENKSETGTLAHFGRFLDLLPPRTW